MESALVRGANSKSEINDIEKTTCGSGELIRQHISHGVESIIHSDDSIEAIINGMAAE